LEDGGDGLNGGRNPPRPRGIDLESTEGTPSGDDRTRIPEGVVERGQRSTVRRVGQLGDQHGGAGVCEGETEADEETGADEHINALGGGLYDSSDNLSKSMGSQ